MFSFPNPCILELSTSPFGTRRGRFPPSRGPIPNPSRILHFSCPPKDEPPFSDDHFLLPGGLHFSFSPSLCLRLCELPFPPMIAILRETMGLPPPPRPSLFLFLLTPTFDLLFFLFFFDRLLWEEGPLSILHHPFSLPFFLLILFLVSFWTPFSVARAFENPPPPPQTSLFSGGSRLTSLPQTSPPSDVCQRCQRTFFFFWTGLVICSPPMIPPLSTES